MTIGIGIRQDRLPPCPVCASQPWRYQALGARIAIKCEGESITAEPQHTVCVVGRTDDEARDLWRRAAGSRERMS